MEPQGEQTFLALWAIFTFCLLVQTLNISVTIMVCEIVNFLLAARLFVVIASCLKPIPWIPECGLIVARFCYSKIKWPAFAGIVWLPDIGFCASCGWPKPPQGCEGKHVFQLRW